MNCENCPTRLVIEQYKQAAGDEGLAITLAGKQRILQFFKDDPSGLKDHYGRTADTIKLLCGRKLSCP